MKGEASLHSVTKHEYTWVHECVESTTTWCCQCIFFGSDNVENDIFLGFR